MGKSRSVTKIRDLLQTCSTCPSQWEAWTEDGRPVYVRYRGGWLTVQVGPQGSCIYSAIQSDEVYGEQVGDEFDGTIGWDRVSKLTGLVSQ